MPPRLALLKPKSLLSDPKSCQNFPEGVGALLRDLPSSPTLIQDEAMTARAPDVHADLCVVITVWPTLSEERRATILRLIQGEEVRG
jgi:hypothetical protein